MCAKIHKKHAIDAPCGDVLFRKICFRQSAGLRALKNRNSIAPPIVETCFSETYFVAEYRRTNVSTQWIHKAAQRPPKE